MHLHVCTKWTCDDYQLTDIAPPPRLYLNPSDLQTGWGAIIALAWSGRTQFYNPLRRRWTRTWFWFTLCPPRGKQLAPMKRPWPAPDRDVQWRRADLGIEDGR